jgi:metal-responsive CopG/Arc/MetJ family transcriptional regulator
MKTAISIPDRVFREAESYARQHGMSRSALYTEAVKTFVDHRKPGEITRQLNALYAKESSALDETLSNMQALSIPRETW